MKAPLSTIKSFAMHRQKALESKSRLDVSRAKAIARIKQLADYWNKLPTDKQRNIVKQLKGEILLILPSANSRFTKEREKILQLLAESRAI